MRRSRTVVERVGALMLATVVAVLGAHVGVPDGGVVEAATGAPSAFEPVGPYRLADTRLADCSCDRIDAETIRVDIGGTELVPNRITAAAVTITITGSTTGGYATVYPSGSSRPVASTVNFPAYASAANSTIVGVGSSGDVDVFVSADAEVIVDVTGVFSSAGEASSGRFVSLAPRRILDGRDADAAVGRMAPGSAATIPLPASVPADATAIAVNVTSLRADQRGYLSGFAAGGQAPDTSFLNVDGSGSPVAAAVILPVSGDGITIVNTAGGRLAVDLNGYFTGSSAPVSAEGLFVATAPTRLLDTRNEQRRLWADGAIEIASPHANAAALVTNVTVARTDAAGFVTAYPAGVSRPVVSALNSARRDQTIPNAAITPVSTRGVGYYGSLSTDLIVDVNGYFTGSPVPATQPVPANTAVPRRVLMVGDSTLAVVRNVRASQDLFVGFDPVLDAQGCRRLVWPSCFSDSDLRTPNTVEEAILGTPGVVDVVVVMAGYNDWNDPFGMFVDTIMSAARSKGARHVVWLTFSEGRQPGSSATAIGVYAENTRDLWASAPRHPDLVVADWRTYNSRSVGWMGSDGVHMKTRGGYGLADYISRWIAHLDGRACTAPLAPGGTPQDPCPSPNSATRVPDIAGLYGV
ncbi:MAG: SGNH/GDSL hydrolase family protein [Ilumatobacter sp.]|uniref:SGNH/GDSL hydrolase family protein n=1 Tax=Ilumatobacter sp. TaxID=1967498 RepID=UPI003C743476